MHFFYQVHTHELFACRCDHMEYTPHIHAQLEMLYVTGGAMDVTVGEQSTRLHAGDLAVTFPTVPTASACCRGRDKPKRMKRSSC